MFTGERLDPRLAAGTQIYHLHHSRYRFAAGLAKSRRVLDVACGTGYGTAEIAAGARRVTAIDLSPATLRDAAATYNSARTDFAAMNAVDLALAAGSFDLVVAFEMIEHMADPDRCLQELHRVLEPGGTLIISAPNRAVHSPGRQSPLHRWHYFEPTVDEFRRLLTEGGFTIDQLLGQHANTRIGTTLAESKRNSLVVAAVRIGQFALPKMPPFLQRLTLRTIRSRRFLWRLLPSYQPADEGDISFSPESPESAMNLVAVCSR